MKKFLSWLLKNRRLIVFFIRVVFKTVNRVIRDNKKEFEKLESEASGAK